MVAVELLVSIAVVPVVAVLVDNVGVESRCLCRQVESQADALVAVSRSEEDSTAEEIVINRWEVKTFSIHIPYNKKSTTLLWVTMSRLRLPGGKSSG